MFIHVNHFNRDYSTSWMEPIIALLSSFEPLLDKFQPLHAQTEWLDLSTSSGINTFTVLHGEVLGGGRASCMCALRHFDISAILVFQWE